MTMPRRTRTRELIRKSLEPVGDSWSTVWVDREWAGTLLHRMGRSDGGLIDLAVRISGKEVELPDVKFQGPYILRDSHGSPRVDKMGRPRQAIVLCDWAARLNSLLRAGEEQQLRCTRQLAQTLTRETHEILYNRIYKLCTGPGMQAPLLGGDDFLDREEVGISRGSARELVRFALLQGMNRFSGEHEREVAASLLQHVDIGIDQQIREVRRLKVGPGEICESHEAKRILLEQTVEIHIEELVDALDGWVVWFLRYPVGSGTGVRKVALRVIEGGADKAIYVHTKDIKDLHQGDYDGDFGYFALSPEGLQSARNRLLCFYRVNMAVRRPDERAPALDVRTPLTARPDMLEALMGMDQKCLVGVYTWHAWGVARAMAWTLVMLAESQLTEAVAGFRLCARRQERVVGLALAYRERLGWDPGEAYRRAHNIFIQLLEKAFDARKGETVDTLPFTMINALRGDVEIPYTRLRRSGAFTRADLKLLRMVARLQTGTNRLNMDHTLTGFGAQPVFDAVVNRRGRNKAAESFLDWARMRSTGATQGLYDTVAKDLYLDKVVVDRSWNLEARERRQESTRRDLLVTPDLDWVRGAFHPTSREKVEDLTGWSRADALRWLMEMGVPLSAARSVPVPFGMVPGETCDPEMKWTKRFALRIVVPTQPPPPNTRYRAVPETEITLTTPVARPLALDLLTDPEAPSGVVVNYAGSEFYCPVSLHNHMTDGVRRAEIRPLSRLQEEENAWDEVEKGPDPARHRLSRRSSAGEIVGMLQRTEDTPSGSPWYLGNFWVRWAQAVLRGYRHYVTLHTWRSDGLLHAEPLDAASYINQAVDDMLETLKPLQNEAQLFVQAHELEILWQQGEGEEGDTGNAGRLAVDREQIMKCCFWLEAQALGYDPMTTSKSHPGQVAAYLGGHHRAAWMHWLYPLADGSCLHRSLRELRAALAQGLEFTHPSAGHLPVHGKAAVPEAVKRRVMPAMVAFVDTVAGVPYFDDSAGKWVNPDQAFVTEDGVARFEATYERSLVLDEIPDPETERRHHAEKLAEVGCPFDRDSLAAPRLGMRNVAGFWKTQKRYTWTEQRHGDEIYKLVLPDAVKGMARHVPTRWFVQVQGEVVPIHLIFSAQAVRDKKAQTALRAAVLSTLGTGVWTLPADTPREKYAKLDARIGQELEEAGRTPDGRLPIWVEKEGRLAPLTDERGQEVTAIAGWLPVIRTPHDDRISTKVKAISLSMNDRMIGGVPFRPDERDREQADRMFDLYKATRRQEVILGGDLPVRSRDSSNSKAEYDVPAFDDDDE